MRSTDLVVVLPGIMGSTLSHGDEPLWAVTPGTLIDSVRYLGQQLAALRLPDGIGDEHPEDGVEPGQLMPTIHGIPKIWTPVKGYTQLLNFLRKLGYEETSAGRPGNLLPIAYDWRLSNRYNGRRIKQIVEPALEQWRSRGGRYQEAQIVFVCHSMGGLVARWYIEMEGGAEVTRKLVTLGTPYRGAAKALGQLMDHQRRSHYQFLGKLGPDLTALARTFPSMYQLLPEYACIARGSELIRTTDLQLHGISSSMASDAMRFHTDLTLAEHSRGQAVHEMTHAIIGIRQTTVTTVRFDNPQARYPEELPLLGPHQLWGDGTVPLAGAVRRGISLDSPLIRRIADKHGNLQCNQAVFDEIEGALTGQDVVVRASRPIEPTVDVPEVADASRPLPITITLGENHGVRVILKDEHGVEVDTLIPRPVAGIARVQFEQQRPGGYSVDVVGLHPASPIQPISSDVILWGCD
ncbi:MAG: hypothetical protein HY876_02550 [Coriobacteriales bacterium]|nr:hypothetical protein [Coriobacteriales bacterium]